MLEGRDASGGHSQQYFSVRGRWFWKLYELQPFITIELFRSHCAHISSRVFSRTAFKTLLVPIMRSATECPIGFHWKTRARKKSECQNLGRCQNSGQLYEGLPDGVFLYVELLDFEIQRRPRNPEFGSGSIWAGNFSVAFPKTRFDEFLLIVLEVPGERT